jgi:hypothetical protein
MTRAGKRPFVVAARLFTTLSNLFHNVLLSGTSRISHLVTDVAAIPLGLQRAVKPER